MSTSKLNMNSNTQNTSAFAMPHACPSATAVPTRRMCVIRPPNGRARPHSGRLSTWQHMLLLCEKGAGVD